MLEAPEKFLVEFVVYRALYTFQNTMGGTRQTDAAARQNEKQTRIDPGTPPDASPATCGFMN
tara:strand:- start:20984 stop:21169 length:186 start_codon:yes stop_codon:yes gene_type:complete